MLLNIHPSSFFSLDTSTDTSICPGSDNDQNDRVICLRLCKSPIMEKALTFASSAFLSFFLPSHLTPPSNWIKSTTALRVFTSYWKLSTPSPLYEWLQGQENKNSTKLKFRFDPNTIFLKYNEDVHSSILN